VKVEERKNVDGGKRKKKMKMKGYKGEGCQRREKRKKIKEKNNRFN